MGEILDYSQFIPSSEGVLDNPDDIMNKDLGHDSADRTVEKVKLSRIEGEYKNLMAMINDSDGPEEYEILHKREQLKRLFISYFEGQEFLGIPKDLVPDFVDHLVNYVGTSEQNRETDRFFREFGVNFTTDKQARCAAFLSYMQKELGLPLINSKDNYDNVRALRFIDESGKGHVGYKIGEPGEEEFLFGGNQGDMVSIEKLDKQKIIGWVLPINVGSGKEFINRKGDPNFDVNSIPNLAIVVYSRGNGNQYN